MTTKMRYSRLMRTKKIIEIRNADSSDIDEIVKVVKTAYGELGTYRPEMIRG
ncbi:MAG: hypothetical protein ACO20H_12895 [Bacteriovoracaceae bacterium]